MRRDEPRDRRLVTHVTAHERKVRVTAVLKQTTLPVEQPIQSGDRVSAPEEMADEDRSKVPGAASDENANHDPVDAGVAYSLYSGW